MSDLHHRVADTHAILTRIARDFTPAVFASSLAAEDMVLTDLILKAKDRKSTRLNSSHGY